MKLDDLTTTTKLTLDVTPLIDVVFLLVLFFAVSTSFISPEKLDELKDRIASLYQEKQQLEEDGQKTNNILEQRNTVLASQRQKLDSQSQRIVIQDKTMAQLRIDLASLNDQRQVQEQMLVQKNQAIQENDKQLQLTNSELQRQSKTVVSLNERIAQLVLEFEKLAANAETTIGQLHKDVHNLSAENANKKQSLEEKALQFSAQTVQLTKSDAMVKEQTQTIAALNQRIQGVVDEYNSLTALSQQQIKQLDQRIKQLLQQLAERNHALDEIQAALRQQTKEKDQVQLSLQEQQSENKLLQTNLEVLQDANTSLSNNVQALAIEMETLQVKNERYKKVFDVNHDQLQRLANAQMRLRDGLKTYLENQKLGIKQEQDRLIIQLSDKILFDSGSAVIKPQGLEVLTKVGALLKTKMQGLDIQVGGHTDNVPIRKRRGLLSNNWGLSALRSVNVVRYFEKKVGLSAKYLSAAGYSEYRPIADNKTVRGRSLNRRIEIVLLPRE